MAEEFQNLPIYLQKISSTLVHNRKSRTAVICGVIVLMSLTSSISLIDIEGHKPDDKDSPLTPRKILTTNTDELSFQTSNNRSPIILNLSLKANINNSFIINVNKLNDTHCGDDCLKNLIGNVNGIINDAKNITRLNNETSNIIQNLNRKLNNLKQGELETNNDFLNVFLFLCY